MTDEQIFELVKEHFIEEWCEEDGNGWKYELYREPRNCKNVLMVRVYTK
jgi:hypothetical protein